jgi:formate dehydrogenase alpha subunit
MTNSIAELEKADLIWIEGSNTSENHPVIAVYIKQAVRRGAKLIVVDPRRIDLAEHADLFLPIRVGTDIALVNAVMHVILRDGLENREFVEEHTENFVALKKHLEQHTPEKAEKITGVPAEKIEQAAKWYATAPKAAICYTMGVTQHTVGTANVRTLANLAMLCGHIGRPSTGVNPLRGQNNVQGACDMGALPNVFTAYQKVDNPEASEKFSKAWNVALPDKPGLKLTKFFDAMLEGKIKTFYCFGENPVLSEPDMKHTRKALKAVEFMVAQDLFLTETAEYADVVFPAAAPFECNGTFTNTERRVQRVRKAVEPLGKSRCDWQVFNELAKRWGYELIKGQTAQEIWDEEIRLLSPSMTGITYKVIENIGDHWPKPQLQMPGTPYLHAGGKFARGKGEFVVIDHVEPAELPDDKYPFMLTTGRRLRHYHTATLTRRAAGFEDVEPEALLEVNPADAEELGIEDGEYVKVSSRRGSIIIKVWNTERVTRGTVFTTFHFVEANANVLTNNVQDPQSGIPELKAAAVQVEKLGKGDKPPKLKKHTAQTT